MTINKDELVKIRHFAAEKFGAHFRWGPIVSHTWNGKKENLKFRLSAKEIEQIQENINNDTEIEFSKLDPWERENKNIKVKSRYYKY
mgnify:CR=1 FL=1